LNNRTPHPKAISTRLALSSIAWIAASLLVTGLLLVWLFSRHVEQQFDSSLHDHLEELVAAGETTELGKLELSWTPADPRFNRPLSGWYWQITQNGLIVASSPSTLDNHLSLLPGVEDARHGGKTFTGPDGQALRAIVQNIYFPDSQMPFTFVIAGPQKNIDRDTARFAGQVALTLAVLGIAFVGLIFLQIGFGLKPLRRLQESLIGIRNGKARTLPDNFPKEVRPVVSELNALLDYNSSLVERARTQAANLAHALKNPLTVLKHEARQIEGDHGDALRQQLNSVIASIDHHLARGRAAGARNLLGARTSVAEVAGDLKFLLERIYANRPVDIRLENLDGLYFRGDPQDLEEMLGNLMDNGCKWARSVLCIRGEKKGDRLILRVEDDGPGLAAEKWLEALKPGMRLDETIPGSGLGLAIVGDIAELYGGTLDYNGASESARSSSPKAPQTALGGLLVRLNLPAI